MRSFYLNKNLFLLVFCFVVVLCDFDPFADKDLFSINWAGPRESNLLDEDLEVVNVQTAENEKYQCVIPESQASKDAIRKANYAGATPDELMEKLFQQNACSYRIESYWTYELCHGKHVRQYHENKEMGLQKPKMQEYFLGKVKEKKKESAGTTDGTKEHEEKESAESTEQKKPDLHIPVLKVDGLELPYVSINMTDGTLCDLNGKPRKSRVMYICQPDGRGEIYLLKEVSTCEYDIIVLTSVLCSHPQFKPKDPPVNQIKCHSVGESPWRPLHLQQMETEVLIPKKEDIQVVAETEFDGFDDDEDDDIHVSLQRPPKQTTPEPKHHKKPTPKPDTTIGITADKQLLREFLTGDYCLHGGGGWWKHEFCYGKYAKQYHSSGRFTQGLLYMNSKDRCLHKKLLKGPDGNQEIYLGHWNKARHFNWLANNPGKKPKAKGQRKQLSLFYSEGDICDLTGQKRYVEVKLKCLNKPQQPHAVSIYLVEPKACEYILGVESPIFCDLLDQADEHGLLDHIKV